MHSSLRTRLSLMSSCHSLQSHAPTRSKYNLRPSSFKEYIIEKKNKPRKLVLWEDSNFCRLSMGTGFPAIPLSWRHCEESGTTKGISVKVNKCNLSYKLDLLVSHYFWLTLLTLILNSLAETSLGHSLSTCYVSGHVPECYLQRAVG